LFNPYAGDNNLELKPVVKQVLPNDRLDFIREAAERRREAAEARKAA
jgi:hypothetical protein